MSFSLLVVFYEIHELTLNPRTLFLEQPTTLSTLNFFAYNLMLLLLTTRFLLLVINSSYVA